MSKPKNPYYFVDCEGRTWGCSASLTEAWEDVDNLAAEYKAHAPYTVYQLVPTARPLPPRPTDGFAGSDGCYFRGKKLRWPSGEDIGWLRGDEYARAAALWERHKAWLAAGGKDDAPFEPQDGAA